MTSDDYDTDGAFPVAPLLQQEFTLWHNVWWRSGRVMRYSASRFPGFPGVITNVIRNLVGSVALFFLGAPNSTVTDCSGDDQPGGAGLVAKCFHQCRRCEWRVAIHGWERDHSAVLSILYVLNEN